MKLEKDLYQLTSIDEHGSRVALIPAEVKGYFRKHRSRVHILLLLVFLLLPWLHYHEKQLILLNIPQREFLFFGFIFKSHDAPLIFLGLMMATLGLAFVTAIWGRVWCGWACPQTVFIDAIYRRLERWAEGSYLQRRQLQVSPWTFTKLRKKTLKWVLFFLVSALISHSFVAYFTGSYELLEMMQGPPQAHWNYFLWILFFTTLVLFDFGWFREQFCVIMCPYGRIQSVLLEPSSLAVVYDQDRGEPRKSLSEEKQGDCVNCRRCVEVCPTGIDIRNGLQMECIACTACIDACDEIMQKIKKPQGLIRYQTLNGSRLKVFKVKTLFYGCLVLVAALVLFLQLKTRTPVNVAVLRAVDSPYNEDRDSLGNIQIINHFKLHLTSQTEKDLAYEISLSEEDQKRGFFLTVAQNPLLLKGRESATSHVFIRVPLSRLPASGKTHFTLMLTSARPELSSAANSADELSSMNQVLTFLGPVQ